MDLVTYHEDAMIESGDEEEEDNSVGLHVITYKEALNAIVASDIDWLEHDKVLSSLQKHVVFTNLIMTST